MATEAVGILQSTSKKECTAQESQQSVDHGNKLPDSERIFDEARSKKEMWLRMKERRSSAQRRGEKEDGLRRSSHPMSASTSSGRSGSSTSGDQCETASTSEQSFWTSSTSSCSSSRYGSGPLNELFRSVFGKRQNFSDSSGSNSQAPSAASSLSLGKELQINNEFVLGGIDKVLDEASRCKISDDFDDTESVPDEHDEVSQEFHRVLTATMHIQQSCGPGARFAQPPKVKGSLEAKPKASDGNLKRGAPTRKPNSTKERSAKCAEAVSKVGDIHQSSRQVQHGEKSPFFKASNAKRSDGSQQSGTRKMGSTSTAVQQMLCKEMDSFQADFQKTRSLLQSEEMQAPGSRRTKRTARSDFAEALFDSWDLDDSVDDLFLEYYHWRAKRGLPVNGSSGIQATKGRASSSVVWASP